MILTVCAQKGGTSKTTTASAIAQAFTHLGRKALLVDTDAQGSASLIYGAAPSPGLYGVMTGQASAEQVVQHRDAGDILPASVELDRLDMMKPGRKRDFMLTEAIKPLLDVYDDVVIDTAPGMGTLLIQALTAADSALVPLQADSQSLQGLHKIAETIHSVMEANNPHLSVAGIVITRFDGRTRLSRQFDALMREQCQQMGLVLADTHVRASVAVQEAQALRRSLYDYAPKSTTAQDYLRLVEELHL